MFEMSARPLLGRIVKPIPLLLNPMQIEREDCNTTTTNNTTDTKTNTHNAKAKTTRQNATQPDNIN